MKITIYLVAGLCCALAHSVNGKSLQLEIDAPIHLGINPLPMPLPIYPEFEPNNGPIFRSLTNIAWTTEQVVRRIIHLVRKDVDEISFFINSNLELFSVQAVSEVYPKFEKIQTEIDASGNCGNKFKSQVQNTKAKLEKELTNCGQNLTNKREEHSRRLNVQTMKLENSLGEIHNLTNACLHNDKVIDSIVCQVKGLSSVNKATIIAQNEADFDNANIEKDIPEILNKIQECSDKAIGDSKKELDKILEEIEKCHK